MNWLRIHRLPKRYKRHAAPCYDWYTALKGQPDTPRQAYIRARSYARYLARPDAINDIKPLFTGEVGRIEGVRFIADVADTMAYEHLTSGEDKMVRYDDTLYVSREAIVFGKPRP